METNLKKTLSIFGVVCFSMTSLFADYSSDDSATGNTTKQATMVPAGTHAGEDGPNVFITADYTYWIARQAGLAYVTSNDYSTAGTTTTPVQGSVFYPAWTGRSGFKVGAGALLNHDGWDLYAEYTWFYNKQNNGKYGANAPFTVNQGIGNWWVDDPTTSVGDVNQANAFWANWFNRVDIQLARSWYAGHYLQLRPFLGLLGAWDEQWYNIRYNDSNITSRWNTWTNNQKWWGVGPYGGLSSAFLFPIGDASTQWSIFMDMGTALPWQKWVVDKQLTDNASSTLPTVAMTRDSCWSTEPMLEMALGLRWETWWNEGMNWNFMLQAAWESQVYFSHNHMVPIGYEAFAGQGDYIMQGLTVKAKIGF